MYKVRGEFNPADLCTEHLARPVLDRLLALIGPAREPGRAETAPEATAEIEPIPGCA